MLFYNIDNTPVYKFSQILRNPKYVCKVPMLKKVCETKALELIGDYNKDKGEDEEVKNLIEDYYLKSLEYKILQYETLYKALVIYAGEEARKEFFEVFKKEFTNDELQPFKQKIDKLVDKYEAMAEDKAQKGGISFDAYVAGLEFILNEELTNKYIYTLHEYEAKAAQKIDNDGSN